MLLLNTYLLTNLSLRVATASVAIYLTICRFLYKTTKSCDSWFYSPSLCFIVSKQKARATVYTSKLQKNNERAYINKFALLVLVVASLLMDSDRRKVHIQSK